MVGWYNVNRKIILNDFDHCDAEVTVGHEEKYDNVMKKMSHVW